MIDGHGAERGVSMTITYVLALGISAALLATLLAGAGAVLEAETERAAERSLETVGQELAGEIEAADRVAGDGDAAVVRVDAPRTVVETGYDVELRQECDGRPGETGCLRLTAHGFEDAVVVPIRTEAVLETGTVPGGPLEVVAADGRLALEVSEA
ncbi:DUF7266 family protein [Natronococcus occultus]|uniref:Uncharacterized protein n=1 Tax=Natronococcus occultus SP4 TaxID=694430 RepID=L0JYP1_9EURY|nr:hypothetical protein [Natronococcus occultus]AGB36978.1 hypothetical protein Natoc_1140 [Natronococcus occultus SP4]